MRTKKSSVVSAGLVTALVVAFATGACSSEPTSVPADDATANVVQSSGAPQSEEEAQADGPSQAELQAYFDALASQDPSAMTEAAEMAAPGSNAQAYAIYRSAAVQSDRDAGFSSGPESVKATEGGFTLCSDEATSADPCAEYTNIQHEGNKIADFDAGGSPLSGRISLGNGEAQPLGDAGEASMIAAYKSIAGAVVVVFEITSNADGMWAVASYTAPDGRQSDSTLMTGPTSLNAGAFANFTYFFEGAEFGGQLHLKAIDGNGYDGGTATFATQ